MLTKKEIITEKIEKLVTKLLDEPHPVLDKVFSIIFGIVMVLIVGAGLIAFLTHVQVQRETESCKRNAVKVDGVWVKRPYKINGVWQEWELSEFCIKVVEEELKQKEREP